MGPNSDAFASIWLILGTKSVSRTLDLVFRGVGMPWKFLARERTLYARVGTFEAPKTSLYARALHLTTSFCLDFLALQPSNARYTRAWERSRLRKHRYTRGHCTSLRRFA
jgi:hypothetical protein